MIYPSGLLEDKTVLKIYADHALEPHIIIIIIHTTEYHLQFYTICSEESWKAVKHDSHTDVIHYGPSIAKLLFVVKGWNIVLSSSGPCFYDQDEMNNAITI